MTLQLRSHPAGCLVTPSRPAPLGPTGGRPTRRLRQPACYRRLFDFVLERDVRRRFGGHPLEFGPCRLPERLEGEDHIPVTFWQAAPVNAVERPDRRADGRGQGSVGVVAPKEGLHFGGESGQGQELSLPPDKELVSAARAQYERAVADGFGHKAAPSGGVLGYPSAWRRASSARVTHRRHQDAGVKRLLRRPGDCEAAESDDRDRRAEVLGRQVPTPEVVAYAAQPSPDLTQNPALRVLEIQGQVKGKNAGKDQNVVLPFGNVYPIGGRQAEPFLGDGGNGLLALLHRELVGEEIPGHLQLLGAGNGDGEPLVERRKQMLAYLAHFLPVVSDLVGRGERQQLALHPGHLVAGLIPNDEQVTQRKHLAVDRVDRLLVFIEDIGVLAEAEQLLADDVFHGTPSFLIAYSANGVGAESRSPMGDLVRVNLSELR